MNDNWIVLDDSSSSSDLFFWKENKPKGSSSVFLLFLFFASELVKSPLNSLFFVTLTKQTTAR